MNQWTTVSLALLSSLPLIAIPVQAETPIPTDQSADITSECNTSDCSVSLNTWSIVAVEKPQPPVEEPEEPEEPEFGTLEGPAIGGPEERSTVGDVGIAVASCTPLYYVDGVAALVPKKGAAAIQAEWLPQNRDWVYQRLQQGDSATQIVQAAMAFGNQRASLQQYGVVTIDRNGNVDTAIGTGQNTGVWRGGFEDKAMAVTVQGNQLVSQAVVANALTAFQTDDPQGTNTLADRLMRALEAGSAAGGDRRCGPQKSASAAILVARATDPPYTTSASKLTYTSMFSANRPWLALSVTKSLYSSDAVARLREYYDAWRTNQSLLQNIQLNELSGSWRSNDYLCGGFFRNLNLDVGISGNNMQAVKTLPQGYACLPTGQVSFFGNLPSTLTIGEVFPIKIRNPSANRLLNSYQQAYIRVISPDLFEVFPPVGVDQFGLKQPPAWFLHFSRNK